MYAGHQLRDLRPEPHLLALVCQPAIAKPAAEFAAVRRLRTGILAHVLSDVLRFAAEFELQY